MKNEYKVVIASIAPLDITSDEIKDDMRLVEDLSFDSLAFVSMIIDLEKVYDTKFDEEYINMERLKTVKDVAVYIQTKVKQK